MTLETGVYVCYARAEPRPNVTCPECELSGESVDESSMLESCVGEIGIVMNILDPAVEVVMSRCRGCRTSLSHEQWRENGIMVMFLRERFPSGVWAFPTELEVVPEPLVPQNRRDYLKRFNKRRQFK